MKETVIYVDKEQYEIAVKEYGTPPISVRVTNTILGRVKTKVIFKLKES